MSSWNFPSSGNAEQDEAEAAHIRLSMQRCEQGLCPNDATKMVNDTAVERHCPQCGFVEFRRVLGVGVNNHN
jgi:predicted RNA-binding Zn-ribbon protein involved in translation (DUF1610 family)